LFPADPKECFDQALTAFDAAERLQTPVIVLSDLDIGMNDWMIPALEWDKSYVPDRGKVLDAEGLEKIAKFERYADPDGDGIPYRSLPGVHPKGGFFTRGSGHNEAAQYTEDGAAYVRLMNRLKRKLDGAPNYLPAPVLQPASSPTTTGVIAYGSSHEAVREALAMLAEDGRAIDYLRVRSFPFGRDVQQFLDAHEQVFVVEQNRDGQMRTLLLNELDVEKSKMVPILHFDGMPITSKTVAERMNDWLAEEAAA